MTVDPPAGVALWTRRAERMGGEWKQLTRQQATITANAVRGWSDRATAMHAEQVRLTSAGAWATGPSTLLGALRLQHSEVLLTRALAWLLQPRGRHGMSTAALDALAAHLGLAAVLDSSEVRVVTEESRMLERPDGQTISARADLVVYTGAWTLVLEAKVFAPEQPEQLDRLQELWAKAAEPCFVFLTRRAHVPQTARKSAGMWRSLTWPRVARLLRAALPEDSAHAGVTDFIETLEAYHGG